MTVIHFDMCNERLCVGVEMKSKRKNRVNRWEVFSDEVTFELNLLIGKELFICEGKEIILVRRKSVET